MDAAAILIIYIIIIILVLLIGIQIGLEPRSAFILALLIGAIILFFLVMQNGHHILMDGETDSLTYLIYLIWIITVLIIIFYLLCCIFSDTKTKNK